MNLLVELGPISHDIILVFVIFDVKTIFLYPWAMSFNVLEVYSFIFVVFYSCFRLCMTKRSIGMS